MRRGWAEAPVPDLPAAPHGAPFARQAQALARRWQRGVPGVVALLAMAPEQRGYVPLAEARARGCREAAALVLLYPLADTAHIALTLRRADLADHAGQVSLPGGRCEPGEAPATCALREAWEELAVPPELVTVIGPLTPVYIAPSGHCVHPLLAVAPSRPPFRPAEAEVAALLEVPLAHLTDSAYRRHETWQLHGEPRQVPFFALAGHKVWGATAMMLSELAALWSTLEDGAVADAQPA